MQAGHQGEAFLKGDEKVGDRQEGRKEGENAVGGKCSQVRWRNNQDKRSTKKPIGTQDTRMCAIVS